MVITRGDDVFLLDTNCWTQVIRRREFSPQVERLLTEVPADRLFVSDYSVHGIGIIMLRYGMIDRYAETLSKFLIGTGVAVIGVSVDGLGRVAAACTRHGLDFDDAYQYAVAESHDLKIVSYDRDFDRSPAGRLTPEAALQLFKTQS